MKRYFDNIQLRVKGMYANQSKLLKKQDVPCVAFLRDYLGCILVWKCVAFLGDYLGWSRNP